MSDKQIREKRTAEPSLAVPSGVETTTWVKELSEAKPSRIISSCAELMETAQMARRIEMLLAAADRTGDRRRDFLASVQALADDEPAVCMAYGDVSVAVNKDGKALFDEDGKLAKFPTGVGAACRSLLPGSAPGNKRIGTILIPSGVCGIVAGGGEGKTPLAHSLASSEVPSYSVVRVGEPLAGYASSSFSQESIAYSLAISILESSDIVLDSIKDLLSGGGAAMKSGLSREALTSLSGWASTACDAGCTIYIPINPSTPDPEVLQLLIEAGKSNATMLVAPLAGSEWNYFNRKGEGLQRTVGTLELRFEKTGLATVSPKGKTGETSISEEEFTRVIASVLSRDAVSNAARRALTIANQE